jgi:predicted acetyltransferase
VGKENIKVEIVEEKDRKCKRHLLIDEGVNVCRLGEYNFNIRVGNCVLKAAGIAGLHTYEEYRNRGYASILMKEATKKFKEDGYDISILNGIPNFYHKFGYATVIPKYNLLLSAKKASEANSYYNIKAVDNSKAVDKDIILSMYNDNQTAYSGSTVRDKDWKGFVDKKYASFFPEIIFVFKEGNIKGYCVYDKTDESTNVYEIWAEDWKGYSTFLRYLGDRVLKKGKDTINLLIPPNHPFTLFSRGYTNSMNIDFPYNQGFMAKIINISSLFEKFLPEIRDRVIKYNYEEEEEICFVTDIGKITLQIRSQDVKMIENPKSHCEYIDIGQDNLIGLIMGYVSVEGLFSQAKLEEKTENTFRLLRCLFPTGYPHTWLADFF